MVLLVLLLLGAGPVERKNDDGVVDWSARVIRVNGVGTPRILSPTGALTPKDPYAEARGDARARLKRLLARLRVEPGKRLSDYKALRGRSAAAVEGFTSTEARRFSDGTVHLPAQVTFDWVPAAVAGLSPLPVEGEVSGLVLRVEGKVQPRLRVRLRGKARTVSAGFPGDPVGSGGVAWFHDEASALAWPGVGPKPRLATARVRGGVLELVDTDAAVLDGVPGGLALVSP